MYHPLALAPTVTSLPLRFSAAPPPPVFAALAGEEKGRADHFLLPPREARGGGGAALKRSGSDVTVGASAGGTPRRNLPAPEALQ